MFNAQFVSAQTGVSKSGNDWFKMELIAETVAGGAKVVSQFCTENAYRNTIGMKPMQSCKVASGINEKGYLVINAIKANGGE